MPWQLTLHKNTNVYQSIDTFINCDTCWKVNFVKTQSLSLKPSSSNLLKVCIYIADKLLQPIYICAFYLMVAAFKIHAGLSTSWCCLARAWSIYCDIGVWGIPVMCSVAQQWGSLQSAGLALAAGIPYGMWLYRLNYWKTCDRRHVLRIFSGILSNMSLYTYT